jgi:hypothetical protein
MGLRNPPALIASTNSESLTLNSPNNVPLSVSAYNVAKAINERHVELNRLAPLRVAVRGRLT